MSMEKKVSNSGVQELAIIVGAFLFTKKNVVTQSDTKLIGSVIDSGREFNQ